MFFDTFKNMFKEEWRIHTSSFENKAFASFPIIIFTLTAIASYFLPYVLRIMDISLVFKYVHYMFMFLGISVGAFGLFGKEIMNRRFGQASLIAYSSRSLPISERTIFSAFFLKDILYYLILWILPIIVGFIVMTPFIGIQIFSSLLAGSTLILSFLIGLSLIFFLSTIFAHSSKILILIISILVVGYFAVPIFLNIQFNLIILPYSFYYTHSMSTLAIISLLIIIPAIISVVFVKIDYPEKKKHHKNLLPMLTKKFSFSRYSHYIAKDFIDLQRSEGGLGKIIFSFLLPIGFTYFFLTIFLELIPNIKIIMIFSIFLGIVSNSIYNMINAFDTFNPYMFLPVKVSTIIKSKITSFVIINSISIIILLIATLSMNQIDYFLPALLMLVSITAFSLATTVYFTGLNPNVLIYNTKIFIPYIGLLGCIIFIFTLSSILNPFYMLASPLILPVSVLLLKKSYKKWDSWKPYSI